MKWEPQTFYDLGVRGRFWVVQRYTTRFFADPLSAPDALWRSRARAAHEHFARGHVLVVISADGRELARIDPDTVEDLHAWRS